MREIVHTGDCVRRRWEMKSIVYKKEYIKGTIYEENCI